jgi:hypothetical protein
MTLYNILGFSAHQLYCLKEEDKDHLVFFNGSMYSIPDKENISTIIKLLENSLNDHDYIVNKVKEFNEIVEKDELNKYNEQIDKPKQKGFIYIAFCSNSNSYKIGRTKNNPIQRISGLYNSNMAITHYYHFATDDMNTENILHKKFASKRISENREWFNLDNSDIDYIMNTYNDVKMDIVDFK